jgi:hypothetical protein
VRIRRSIIAPLVLSVGALAGAAVPVVSALTAVTPAAVSASPSPNAIIYMG